jgi:hypothetical protein
MADAPVLRIDEPDVAPSSKNERTVLVARLQEAARTESKVRCVYFGGSKAGIEREIIPIKIDPPDVWALCVTSGRRKRFRLGLIYILEPGEDPRWAKPLEDRSVAVTPPSRIDARSIRTLSQLIQDHGETLDALGWRMALADQAITLQRITDEAGEVVVALRQRENGHWVVESLDKPRVKRRQLGAAAKIFLAAADRNARTARRGRATKSARSGGRGALWSILSFLVAAVLALVVGVTIGVLLPH